MEPTETTPQSRKMYAVVYLNQTKPPVTYTKLNESLMQYLGKPDGAILIQRSGFGEPEITRGIIRVQENLEMEGRRRAEYGGVYVTESVKGTEFKRMASPKRYETLESAINDFPGILWGSYGIAREIPVKKAFIKDAMGNTIVRKSPNKQQNK